MNQPARRVVTVTEGVDFRELGGTVRRLIHPATVGPTNLGLSIVFMNPGEEVVRHRHASEEAYFVVQGEGVMYLEGHPDIRLVKNLAVYIPSNAVHGQKNTGDEPLIIIAALSPPLTTRPEIVAD
jgi:quercetin dioxygenase-like cupin family protein